MVVEQEMKLCSICGTEHKLSFYYKHQRVTHNGWVVEYDTVCKECRSQERKAKDLERPFRKKAKKTLCYHASQERMRLKDFEAFTGVKVDYVEGLFREAWILDDLRQKGIYPENIGNCRSCRHSFEHKRGYDDFTLDKRDPKRPFTRSNIWVICRECNTGKVDKDPTQFDLDSLEYDLAKEAVKKGVQFQLPAEAKIDRPKGKSAIYEAAGQLKLDLSM